MKINFPYWNNSLNTRITLTTLTIFLIGIWSLSFYSSQMLRKDMVQLLGEQQFSTVSFVAAGIDEELNDRLSALNLIAGSVSATILKNPAALQSLLEQRQLLQQIFNAGVFVTGTDGIAIASTPVSLGRVGTNYMDRDYIVAALKEGKAMTGKPIIGRKLGVPVFVMAVPVRDIHNKIIGALAGVVDLSKPNFLNKITEGRYGKTGGYVLLSPQHRLIVTASDKTRTMQPLPAPGVNPALDRFLQGYEGSAVYTNPLGVHVLGSAKQIPASDWLLGLTLPSTEAFSPIDDMQQRMFFATIFFTLVAGILTWWILRRQFLPMLEAVKTMTASSANRQPPQPLPISRHDEIGTLIEGFNLLLKTLTQREAALGNSENRSRAIIEASPLPLAINDADGNITFLNQAFIQTLGYTLSDIPTLADWWPRAYPDPQHRQQVADRWQKNLADAKQSGKPFAPLEINIHCKDGSERTFMVSASPLGNSFSGEHLVILYDITERKLAEQALITKSETLKEAQRIAHIGNWNLNLLSGELLWSDEIFRLFEIDPNRFGATYEAFLNTIHPDDREAVNQAYSSSLVTRMAYEITHRLRMSDGRIKWVTEKCVSTFDAAGKPLQSRGMVQDITEHKQAEQALMLARDDAERANRAKSAFLSSMSHELRTPMNAILGYSQLMQLDEAFPENHKSGVKEMLAAGYHLLALIDDVLDLSRIESGRLQLTLESVEVCAVVDECLKLVNAMAIKRHIRLDHNGVKGVAVRADYRRLTQILLNLLSNAIKYNREGGSVNINVQHHGTDRLRIQVTDSGRGIPAARLAELFEPFNRLGAESSNIEGTGIGLTITRRIVEEMDGSVEVESEVGVGSTFTLELPLAPAS